MTRSALFNRQTIAWALYDWGNSAFALSVLAVLFPLYLGLYWSAGDPGPQVTSRLSFATALASLVVALIAPVIGAMADRGGSRKRLLVVFTFLGVLSTASLSLVEQGGWVAALTLFGMASIGYYSANVFYDSLLMNVCEPRHYSLVSSLGLALGYFGGAILLTLHLFVLRSPGSFGFDDTDSAFRFSFVSVGIWWLICLVPLLLYVEESRATNNPLGGTVTAAYRALKDTFLKIRDYRDTFKFLIAYWFYIGGLFTVIFMAVNFGQRKGFAAQDLVTALLITNFVGFPATLGMGYIGHRFGARQAIYIGLAVYIAVICWAPFMENVREFYIMSIIIGTVQGGVQGMSRSFYASLIPAQQSGEFFGFYNAVTKFAHILGPVLVGTVAIFTDEPNYILLAILPMFVIGAVALMRVQSRSGVRT